MRTGLLPLALLAALPCQAESLRVDYVLGASFLHSDNISLGDTDRDSESVLSPEVSFEATQSGSSTSFKARGSLQYLDYRDDTYGDEARGDFAGQFNWMLLPQRLTLVVEDYLGRQPIDFTAGYSPGNQQQINVFTAGPSLFARFGTATRAQFDLRYSDTYAEETREFNGNRYMAAGRLFRDLGTSRWLSANVEASSIRFDLDTPSADYDRYDAFVGYRRESTRLNLDVAVGYTRLEQDNVAGSESSPLARAQLDWQLAPRSLLSATASYQFADTASDLVANSSRLDALVIEDVAAPTGLVGPAVYRQRRYEVGYRYTGERWNFQVRPYLERTDYNDATLVGWETRGGYFNAEFQLRPRLALTASASREDREFADGSRSDRDTLGRIGLTYDFSRHLSGSVGWQRRERDSAVPGQDSRENVAPISVSYRR
jgi:hypothetical protein